MFNILLYIIDVLIAGYISFLSYSIYWWAPAILMPLLMYLSSIFNFFTIPNSDIMRNILNGLNILISTVYLGSQAYIFYINIGWYGGIIGVIVGYFGVPFIVHEIWRN